MILMIIGAAAVFSYMMSLLYVTQSAAQALVDLDLNRWVLMLAINVFLLVAGCFLPPVAIILMVMPILTPVLEADEFRPDLVRGDPHHQHGSRADHPAGGTESLRAEGRGARRPAHDRAARIDAVRAAHVRCDGADCRFPDIALWLPNQMMGAG